MYTLFILFINVNKNTKRRYKYVVYLLYKITECFSIKSIIYIENSRINNIISMKKGHTFLHALYI